MIAHKSSQMIIATFFSVAVVVPLVWMVMDRSPPYIRLSGEMIPPNPAQGEFVSVRWRIKVIKPCPPNVPRNVTRRIIDSTGVVIDYEPIEGVFGAEGETIRDSITRSFQIPPSAALGPAKYQSSASFACNPFQTLWPVFVSEPNNVDFEITKPKE